MTKAGPAPVRILVVTVLVLLGLLLLFVLAPFALITGLFLGQLIFDFACGPLKLLLALLDRALLEGRTFVNWSSNCGT